MKISHKVGRIEIRLETSRLDQNLREAQKLLNEQIVADCDELIPFRQGALRGSQRYPKGIYGGEISYGGTEVPYAHYQYEGVVYGPNFPKYDENGNIVGWASPAKKYATDRKIKYHTKGTTGKWFEEAKRRHGKDWEKLVRDTMGGK